MHLKEWQKILLLIGFCFLSAWLFFRFLLGGLQETTAAIPSQSILELTIAGDMPERSPDEPLSVLFGNGTFLTMQDALKLIRNARRDERIKAVVLKPLGVFASWAKTDELRTALLDYKRSGKPLYAYLEFVSERDYYLATAADTLVGLGTGIWAVDGISVQPTFFKETLGKIGVEADFVAHKEYKTAPQEYTRSSLSPEGREVIESLLDHYYDAFFDTLVVRRAIDRNEMQLLIDKGLFSIQEARRAGLIDTLMYYENFKKHLTERQGKSISFVNNSRYGEVSASQLGVNGKETIAVVFGTGTIISGGERLYRQGNIITSSGMAKAIRAAANDDDVKAIILRLDSPGGSGTASDIIWKAVREAREKKPVIASVSGMAASGGYYIAMAADTILAHPHSLVGSIGIYAGKFSLKGLYEKVGLSNEVLKRGRNADIFSDAHPFTPEQRQILNDFLLEFYNDFVQKAAAGRGKTPAEIEPLAKGRVWTGEEAMENGLIDVLGDFSDAIRIAKEMCDIPADEAVRLALYPRMESYFERLLTGQFPLSVRENNPLVDHLLREMPAQMRQLIKALPHFKTGEPLYLELRTF